MEINNPTVKPVYNPVLMALSNIIIPGAGYLVLHLYAKFFIVYCLIFLLVIVPRLINILFLAGISSLLSLLLFIFVIVDTYAQTAKINNGTLVMVDKKKALAILGIFLIIIFTITYVVTGLFAQLNTPRSPSKKSDLQVMKEYSLEDKKTKEILTRYPQKIDAHCESFRNDPTLIVGSYYSQYNFVSNCYLKKAIETNDPLYCGGFEVGRRYDIDCIAAFAVKNRKPELCNEMLALGESTCAMKYDVSTKVHIDDLCANDDMPEAIKQRCRSEFGVFFTLFQ